jgi:hypothetical protein
MKKAAWMLCILPIFAGCVFEERVPIETVSMNQTQPLGNEKNLDTTVNFGIGSLELTGDEKGASIYSLNLEYDRNTYEPEIQYNASQNGEEGRFNFNLKSTHKMGLRRERHNNRLRLAFSDSIPLKLRVVTGVGDARLSLSGLKLARLDFESGVGGSKMSAYEPNPVSCESIRLKNGVGSIEAVGLGNLNFRELEFEGGVGGANLDFTGEWKQSADIRIQVGVGGVNLSIPRDLGVRVEAEKHFLSGLQLEGFSKRDTDYYSENYDKAAVRISVRVITGIGGFKITWV